MDSKEKIYLLEDKDGFLVRVPERKLEAWEKAQARADEPLNNSERQVVDRIVSMLYGRKG